MPHYNSDGYGSHLYVPWWGWDKHQKLGFPRGYHIEVGGGYGMPGIGSFQGVVNRTEGYGVKMKQAIRDEYGTSINLVGPRRDDSQRAVLLRDRSGREGSLGDPGAAVPLGLERSRAQPGPAHADDVPRDSRGARRTGGDRRRSRRRTRRAACRIPIARRSRAAARSSTRSARCGWATIRRRARSTSTVRPTR